MNKHGSSLLPLLNPLWRTRSKITNIWDSKIFPITSVFTFTNFCPQKWLAFSFLTVGHINLINVLTDGLFISEGYAPTIR